MNPTVKNILAVVAGCAVAMVVNGSLISLGYVLNPLPEGVDPNDMDSLGAAMKNFGIKEFIMPFLAHALGSLAGAFVATKIGVSNHLKLALIVGAFHLLGGITAAYMLPAPITFEAFDLLVSYIPMAVSYTHLTLPTNREV